MMKRVGLLNVYREVPQRLRGMAGEGLKMASEQRRSQDRKQVNIRKQRISFLCKHAMGSARYSGECRYRLPKAADCTR